MESEDMNHRVRERVAEPVFAMRKAQPNRLTPSECALLRAMSGGMDRKSAAQSLGITVKTANCRMESVRQKLYVKSDAEAVRAFNAD